MFCVSVRVATVQTSSKSVSVRATAPHTAVAMSDTSDPKLVSVRVPDAHTPVAMLPSAACVTFTSKLKAVSVRLADAQTAAAAPDSLKFAVMFCVKSRLL